MKIGDTVFIHGYIDEIRKDMIIVRNNGGYFGTVPSEIICGEMPERKTGKWLPDNNNYYEERFICSVCGKSYKVDTCMGKPMWDFCPCGADMREQP